MLKQMVVLAAVLSLSIWVYSAHLEYDTGKCWAGVGGYAYNATESDPLDDPLTAGHEWRWITDSNEFLMDLTSSAAVSTASSNHHCQFTNTVDASGVTVDFMFDLDGQSANTASGFLSYASLSAEDSGLGNGLSYIIKSDGETAGTPVKIRLSWTANATATGGGFGHFNYNPTGDGLIVTINANPADSIPAAGTVIYKQEGSLYYDTSNTLAKSNTVDFIAAVGDTIGLYCGGYGWLSFDNASASGGITAQMNINLQIAPGRDNIADLDKDRKVTLADLAIMAHNWLWIAPLPSNQDCSSAILVMPAKVVEESTEDMTNTELWYQYHAVEDARCSVSLCGSDFDTRLTAYEHYSWDANPCPGYYLSENDDFCDQQSQLDLDCYSGNTYYFQIDSPSLEVGNVRLLLTRFARPANDDFNNALDAVPGTTYAGSTMGSLGDASVWYKFTPSVSDYYLFSTCGSGFDTTLELYDDAQNSLDFNNDSCGQQSELPFLLVSGLTYYIRVGSDYGERGDYQFMVTQGVAVPVNDDCAGAITVGPWSFTEGSTAAAVPGAAVSTCGGSDNQDVWYRFIAPSDATYTFRVYSRYSHWDKVISLFDACLGTQLDCASTLPNGWVEIYHPMLTSEEVLIRISGIEGLSGHYQLYVY